MFGVKKKSNAMEFPDLSSGMGSMPSINEYKRPQLNFSDGAEDMQKEEIHGLPSFPDSPMRRGFSQSMIKNAVENEEIKESSQLPELKEDSADNLPKKTPRLIELEEWTPSFHSQKSLPSPPMPRDSREQNMPKMHDRPVFVRLDKFKEARQSLESISEKVNQLDELLKMIKDIKAKENAEIDQWEQEIEKIKSRISFINTEIFENAYK